MFDPLQLILKRPVYHVLLVGLSNMHRAQAQSHHWKFCIGNTNNVRKCDSMQKERRESAGFAAVKSLTPSYSLSAIASNHGFFNKSAAVGRFTGSYCRLSLNCLHFPRVNLGA